MEDWSRVLVSVRSESRVQIMLSTRSSTGTIPLAWMWR